MPLIIDLQKIAKRTTRNGWVLSILCGIGVLASLTDFIGLLLTIAGLLTGIQETRYGRRLADSDTPRAQLRTLGRWQLGFSITMLIYFVDRFISTSADALKAHVTPELLPYLVQIEGATPGLFPRVALILRVTYVLTGVIAISWQLWTARRYFSEASHLTIESYLRTVTVRIPSNDFTALAVQAKRQGLTQEQTLQKAIRHFIRTSETDQNVGLSTTTLNTN